MLPSLMYVILYNQRKLQCPMKQERKTNEILINWKAWYGVHPHLSNFQNQNISEIRSILSESNTAFEDGGTIALATDTTGSLVLSDFVSALLVTGWETALESFFSSWRNVDKRSTKLIEIMKTTFYFMFFQVKKKNTIYEIPSTDTRNYHVVQSLCNFRAVHSLNNWNNQISIW